MGWSCVEVEQEFSAKLLIPKQMTGKEAPRISASAVNRKVLRPSYSHGLGLNRVCFGGEQNRRRWPVGQARVSRLRSARMRGIVLLGAGHSAISDPPATAAGSLSMRVRRSRPFSINCRSEDLHASVRTICFAASNLRENSCLT